MLLYDLRKFKVEKSVQLPTDNHWAILVFKPYSIFHEGDERSRTNPGHGYPAYTESGINIDYYAFQDIEVWKVALIALENEKNNQRTDYEFRGIVVDRVARIQTNVDVIVT